MYICPPYTEMCSALQFNDFTFDLTVTKPQQKRYEFREARVKKRPDCYCATLLLAGFLAG